MTEKMSKQMLYDVNIPVNAVKSFRHKTLEERAKEYHGELNLDGEYDWGEPVGRETRIFSIYNKSM